MIRSQILRACLKRALATMWLIFTCASFAAAQPAGGDKNASTPMKSANGKVDFSKANPEDITNENYPAMIDSFDYPNADIAEIVKAISKLTGKNFILEKGVSGKISIIAPSQITVAEAYKAFLTALAMNNFTVVPSGNFLKIRSLQAASKESIDTYAGNYFPNTDQLITRIVKLKYINAEDVQKTLRQIVNQNGDITPYPPTNSLIVTDLGSNVERITNIINQLDVPGFEEKLVVIPIRNARAKDIADIIDKIINKGDKNSNAFTPGIPRFRPGGTTTSSTTGAASYSLVLPDLRTNSIIVVGNDAGIERIRGLVAKLDYRMRAEDGSGVYVYYVRYGEAEKIANVINGIATDSTKQRTQTNNTGAAPPNPIGVGGAPAPANEPIFGADVKVNFSKETNSLVITASRQDWAIVRTILSKIDIPRDQVFVKAIILEMDARNSSDWGVNYYKFLPGGNGIARSSFVTSSNPASLLDPTKDSGLTLGFGSTDTVTLQTPGVPTTTTGAATSLTGVTIPSLLGLIKLIKQTTNANILSAPQLSALDNEEATIEVGENVPIGSSTTTANNGSTTNSTDRHDVTLKMKLTPYISPDTDKVRLKINNKIEQIAAATIQGANAAGNALTYTTRTVDTQVIVNSNDTAVLGGLMEDKDEEGIIKIPILGDIPILGWLFKSKHVDKQKTNLLIFITPRIVRSSEENSALVTQSLDDRLDFIQKNENGRDPYGEAVDKLPRRAHADQEEVDNQLNVPRNRYRKQSGRALPEPDSSTEKSPGNSDKSGIDKMQNGGKKNDKMDDLEALPPNDDTLGPGDVEEGE